MDFVTVTPCSGNMFSLTVIFIEVLFDINVVAMFFFQSDRFLSGLDDDLNATLFLTLRFGGTASISRALVRGRPRLEICSDPAK